MITHAHYVGLQVPHCSLTYGTLPCKAQLTRVDGSSPNLVQLNATYAKRSGGLTGAADSKLLTGSFWVYLSDLGLQNIFTGTFTLGGADTRVTLRINNSTQRFQMLITDTGGTNILNVSSSALQAGNLYHIMFSFDLTSTSKRWLYVDGVSDLSLITDYTNSNMDFTLADWAIGANPDGSRQFSVGGRIADFWFAPGVYLDLSVSANRSLFRTESGQTGRPVDLGSTGQNPTGASPLVCFSDGSVSWFNNLGTGGSFSQVTAGSPGAADSTFATGTDKCFNSLGTCQDIADFSDSPVTLFFGEDVNHTRNFVYEQGDVLFPFIEDISFQSAIISLGDDMGQRGTLSVKFRDAPHNDTPNTQFDSYSSERTAEDGYDPLSSGTFWGKFRARNPYMRFQNIYLYTTRKDSSSGQDTEVERRTYIIDSISGPDTNGEVVITAKDMLKIADGEVAKAPTQSPGFLSADITAIATSATLSPSGIGNSSYPASGTACISGSEVVTFTRAGDVLTLTRAQFNTTGVEHKAQDRVQLVVVYTSQSPDVIIADLLTNYASVDAAFIDTDAWAAEVSAYLGTLYSFCITEPTAVKDLISEIILQIGGAIWWDDVNEQIRLQILRAVPTDAEQWNEDNTISETLKITEQETKRVTEVSVYFAQFNPTLKIDETHNYASVATVNDSATESLVGGKSIKTIFARGIPSGGRSVAERLAQKYLSRYVIPPRRFTLQLMKYSGLHPTLGGGFILGGSINGGPPMIASWPFQDEFGDRVEVPVQVTRVNPVGMLHDVEAEEMLFTAFGADVDPANRTIIFDVSRKDVNLRTIHDSLYATAQSGDTINCYVNSGVIIGSSSTSTPAFEVGLFDAGVTVNVTILGRVQGRGGDGAGVSGNPLPNGQAGGTALYTRQAINLFLDSGSAEVWGGGGGGGSSRGPIAGRIADNSGGGGAGSDPGAAGVVPTQSEQIYANPAASGTTEAGGAAPFSPAGGNGGGPGLAGQNASGLSSNSNGGAAGTAVDGTSFITYTGAGDVRGSQIN